MATGNWEIGEVTTVGTTLEGELVVGTKVGLREGTEEVGAPEFVGAADGAEEGLLRAEMPVIVTVALHVEVEKQPILKVIVGKVVFEPGTV